jgi:hypothetical protein
MPTKVYFTLTVGPVQSALKLIHVEQDFPARKRRREGEDGM